MYPTVELPAKDISIWGSRGGEQMAWFRARLEDVAAQFRAPILVENGMRAVLLADPDIGFISIQEAPDNSPEHAGGCLEVIVDMEHLAEYYRASSVISDQVLASFDLNWNYESPPEFPPAIETPS